MISLLSSLRTIACVFGAALACIVAEADTIQLAWSITAGSRPYISDTANERGIAYNPVTGHLLVVSRNTSPITVAILEAATGEELGFLDISRIDEGGIDVGQFFL